VVGSIRFPPKQLVAAVAVKDGEVVIAADSPAQVLGWLRAHRRRSHLQAAWAPAMGIASRE
jgi:hypothetical protein